MRILVAGTGYVGEALAASLHEAGHEVVGLTHSECSAARLAETHPFKILTGDLSSLASLTETFPQSEKAFDQVIHCASSGRGGAPQYRKVYFDGVGNLQQHFPEAKLTYTSSTSVYAQTDGSWVDEASPANPDRETGQILRATEDLVLQAGGTVTRLAGIYGPDRSFILLKYLENTAVIEGDGGRYLNQSHRDDIVQALHFLITEDKSGLFNVVDSTPQTQREIYQSLADHFQGDLPPQAPPDYERKRGWTHKRVSNQKILSLGWKPRYPAFQEAIRNDARLVPSIRKRLEESEES